MTQPVNANEPQQPIEESAVPFIVDADDAAPVDLGTPPPGLATMEAGSYECCSTCVFFNKGLCNKYGHADPDSPDTMHALGYPVDRLQVCDDWKTITPADARKRLIEARVADAIGEPVEEAAKEALKKTAKPVKNPVVEKALSSAPHESMAALAELKGKGADPHDVLPHVMKVGHWATEHADVLHTVSQMTTAPDPMDEPLREAFVENGFDPELVEMALAMPHLLHKPFSEGLHPRKRAGEFASKGIHPQAMKLHTMQEGEKRSLGHVEVHRHDGAYHVVEHNTGRTLHQTADAGEAARHATDAEEHAQAEVERRRAAAHPSQREIGHKLARTAQVHTKGVSKRKLVDHLNDRERENEERRNAMREGRVGPRLSAALGLEEVKSDVYPGLDRSPKENWVDKAGGLPKYIERIAKHVHYEHGKPIGTAIAIAVGVCKRWCAGGSVSAKGAAKGGENPKAHVSAKTKALACAAVAEWEAKKAGSHVSEAHVSPRALREATFEDAAADFVLGYALALIDFKPIPPSMNYSSRIIETVEAQYDDWDELVEAFDVGLYGLLPHAFDSSKHLRGRGGKFRDMLVEIDKHAEWAHIKSVEDAFRDHTLPTRQRNTALSSKIEDDHNMAVDETIGQVLAGFKGIQDWDVTPGEGGDWHVHVKLADGSHEITVGADGSVKEAPAPPMKLVKPPAYVTEYEPTGDTNVLSHMTPGTVYQGKDGHLYKHLGDDWMAGKKGPVKGAKTQNLDTGVTKTVPYFVVHGKEYDVMQPKGSAPVKPHVGPTSADAAFQELLDSVATNSLGEQIKSVKGLNVVVTGVIPGHTRNEVHKMISAAGGYTQTTVTQTTNVLVTGDKVGATKINKAKKNGTKVIDWSTFKHLVEAEIGIAKTKLVLVEARLEEATTGMELASLRARKRVLEVQVLEESAAVELHESAVDRAAAFVAARAKLEV